MQSDCRILGKLDDVRQQPRFVRVRPWRGPWGGPIPRMRMSIRACGLLAILPLMFIGRFGAGQAVPLMPRARVLGHPVLTSPPVFVGVSQVRQLSDGRVLVNDRGRRQVILLDANLGNPRIVIDSVAGRDRSYG